MKTCITSYSYRQYTADGRMTLFDCIDKTVELGFDVMEFTTLPGETQDDQLRLAEQLREYAAKKGMPLAAYATGAHLYSDTPFDRNKEILRACGQVDVAAELGVPVMRHDTIRTGVGKSGLSRSFGMMLPYIAEGTRSIAAYAQTRGIRTCVENHGRVAQDIDRMEKLFDAVAHDNFGLLLDCGNFTGVGDDPCRAMSRLGNAAIHVHLKDLRISDDPFEGAGMTRYGNYTRSVPLGDGDVKIKRCLAILKNSFGYDGCLSLEYEASMDCLEGIARGYDFLKKTLAELNWKREGEAE